MVKLTNSPSKKKKKKKKTQQQQANKKKKEIKKQRTNTEPTFYGYSEKPPHSSRMGIRTYSSFKPRVPTGGGGVK